MSYPDEMSRKLFDDAYSPSARPGFGEKWDGGIVPFEAHCSLEEHEEVLFSQAMRHIEQETSIRFVRYDADVHSNYIILTDLRQNIANSFVGKMKVPGWQRVNVDVQEGPGPRHDFGSAVHELIHALGWPHTQSRPDRDVYVTIEYDNIVDRSKRNFDVNKSSDVYKKVQHCRPYNYGSIMHYDDRAFSNNGDLTITTNDISFQNEIGNRNGLNAQDIEEIEEYYFGTPKCRYYTFYKDKNSPGYNIEEYKFQGITIEDMQARCDSLPDCKGFNTGGFMKYRVKDPSKWDNTRGFYIKATSYTFHKNKDSSGFDIEHYHFRGISVEDMMARCDSLPDCLGFNTDGWMKYRVKDPSRWEVKWTNDATKGFYMKSV